MIVFLGTTGAGIFLLREYYFFVHEHQEMIAYKKIYQQMVDEYKIALNHHQEKQQEISQRDLELQEQDKGIEPELCLSEEQVVMLPKSAEEKKVPKRVEQKLRPLRMPIDRASYRLSSRFGSRKKRNGSWGFHYGIDMASPRGTPVRAAASGRVIEAGFSKKGYGKTIVLSHPLIGYQTRYAHLDKILVYVGQDVKVGQKIGLVGSTGFVISENGSNDASHLHFEVKKQRKHIDPLRVLA